MLSVVCSLQAVTSQKYLSLGGILPMCRPVQGSSNVEYKAILLSFRQSVEQYLSLASLFKYSLKCQDLFLLIIPMTSRIVFGKIGRIFWQILADCHLVA